MFEVNLVPDVKAEMIKALKVRNWILFICIMVSAVMIVVVLIMLGIKGGQDLAMMNQNGRIDEMSKKMNEYDNLGEFLTIQNQLGVLDDISGQKTAASRIFGVLDATLPKDEDTVTISDLNLDLSTNILSIEGQANAGKAPFIDYRVLESLKKSVGLVTYDYGVYVDKDGNEIPTACVVETDDDGSFFMDENGYYGNWYKDQEGCDPSKTESNSSSNVVISNVSNNVTKIYRTPQFEKWSEAKHMTTDGDISGVEHFKSVCINYYKDGSKWVTENDSCKLTNDGMIVSESSNGRDSNEELVLRFVATIEMNADVLLFQNSYMKINGPESQNITDSYVQVKDMFAKRASDCAKDDTACQEEQKNNGNSSSSSSGGNK